MSRCLIRAGAMPVLTFVGLALCAGCGTQVGIAASPSEIYVEVGDTATVNVVAVMDVGSPRTVSGGLTITSSEEAVATVSGQAVLGVAEGTATLAITDGTFSTTAVVHVVGQGALPANLVVTPTWLSCNPESQDTQLEVFAVLDAGAGEDVTDQASYRSSDTDVALVTAEGVVVCVAAGQAVITAQYLGASDTTNVVVESLPPRAVDFSATKLICAIDEVYQVQVVATWEDGSMTDVSLYATYSSSDSSVAVASLGQVQCVSEGAATITADVLGVTGALSVDVRTVVADPDQLVDLRINPSSVECGLTQAAQFTVIAEYGDGTTVDVTGNGQTQYASSDSSVALVFQNQVLCVQQGQATVQAGYGGLAASVLVTVR